MPRHFDFALNHIQSGVKQMTFKRPYSAGLAALAVGLFAATAAYAEPTVNKGDNAWMLTSTVLVLLMTIPGLALFYGGLVRSKNMLSVLMQVFYTVCIVVVIWALYGYSLAFTGGSDFIGGFSKAFLMGVTPDSKAATFSVDANISELVYVCFQMTFAAITPALIVGAFAERMKFAAVALFIPLWVTLIYFPIAHMVWYWAGPDAISDAVKAIAAAGSDAAAKAAAEAKLAEVNADAGWVFKKGAIDFAGGTVVHINAGIAGLVGALLIGKRVGYGKDLMAPHSLTMSMIGASLLWVGWFGFNAGSNLEASGGAALAMTNSFVATAAAALSWMFAEWMLKGHPSVLGVISGAVAGLVAVTPAAGYAGPMGAIVLGLVVGVVCLFFVTTVKNALGYDDSLDVFGVHCIGGIIGAIGTGILVNPALGGTGIMDYTTGRSPTTSSACSWFPRPGASAPRWCGPASARRFFTRSSMSLSACASMSKANVRASTSPSTPNAPTTCEFSRGTLSLERAPRTTVWGTYPAMLRPLRGFSASWSPFFSSESGRRISMPGPMVNRVLTSPYLWWSDPHPPVSKRDRRHHPCWRDKYGHDRIIPRPAGRRKPGGRALALLAGHRIAGAVSTVQAIDNVIVRRTPAPGSGFRWSGSGPTHR
jgi:Amt family ammonium transporter